MAVDHYGNSINIGDRVVKVGYSDEYTITDIQYGGEIVELQGNNWIESNVNSNNIIKI